MRHALSRSGDVRPAERHGFWAGVLGVALAAARVAAWLGEPQLHDGARALVADAHLPSEPRRCPDVMMGTAGTIVCLLALATALDQPRLVDQASNEGDVVLRGARVTARGASWPAWRHRQPYHLCGIAHGAGGIGWALAELAAITGEARFGTGAAGAFAYERSWLDGESGLWPDLRIPDHLRRQEHLGEPATVATWCRGEAGIVQTRLSADTVYGSLADAAIGIRTTRRRIARLPHEGIDDLSLCHGAAGSADVLITAGESSPEVALLGELVLERYARGARAWPCGIQHAMTPGLFLGQSGIGWWLLRMHRNNLPSPLATWS